MSQTVAEYWAKKGMAGPPPNGSAVDIDSQPGIACREVIDASTTLRRTMEEYAGEGVYLSVNALCALIIANG